MVTHNLNVLEKHSVFSGNSFPRNFATNRVKRRSIKSEDPLSHRIIEKRRRDRMNNCLADLSRLIPPEYLKKGRGRIEKTEIIEMAIKHIGHLQNVISSARFSENSNGSIPFSPLSSSMLTTNETPSGFLNHPFTLNQYKKGYLECMSEAVHFLVEVQGYFAGDTLCVQMINHLRQHCDKILNGNTFNFSKRQAGGDLTSSESSGSPINIICNGSPRLETSHSAGSPSDDNIPNQGYQTDECYSPESYSEFYWNLKKHSNNGYHEYVDLDGQENGESRSAFESHSDPGIRYQVQEGRKKESRIYCESEKACHGNYHVMSNAFEPVNYDGVPVKDENGLSDSRKTPTSEVVDPFVRTKIIGSNSSNCESPTKENKDLTASRLKTAEPSKENASDPSVQRTGSGNGNHVIMYKFKNNIKQRFSREKSENAECGQIERDECPAKKLKPEECQQWEDSNGKEQVMFASPTTNGEEVYKSNYADVEERRLENFPPKLKFQNGDLSIRLNFGHKANERGTLKRWGGDFGSQCHHPQNPWTLSPTINYEYPEGCKTLGERISLQEYPPLSNNSFNNVSIFAESVNSGIPIFALHAKRSFYVPLTLDPAILAPFLPLLGLAKGPNSDAVDPEKPVLHPVTISVNFQSHLIR